MESAHKLNAGVYAAISKHSPCVHLEFMHYKGVNIGMDVDSDDVETVFVLDSSEENASNIRSEDVASANTDFEEVPSIHANTCSEDVSSVNVINSANTNFEEVCGVTANTDFEVTSTNVNTRSEHISSADATNSANTDFEEVPSIENGEFTPKCLSCDA